MVLPPVLFFYPWILNHSHLPLLPHARTVYIVQRWSLSAGTMGIDSLGILIDNPYTHTNNTEGKPQTIGCLVTRDGKRVTPKGDVQKKEKDAHSGQ